MKRDLDTDLIVGTGRLPIELDLEEVQKGISEAMDNDDVPVRLMTWAEKKRREGEDDSGGITSGIAYYFDEDGKYKNDYLSIYAGKTTDGGSIQINCTGEKIEDFTERYNLILDLFEYIGVEFDRDECYWQIENRLLRGRLPCRFSQRDLIEKLGAEGYYLAERNSAVGYKHTLSNGDEITYQIFPRGKFSILGKSESDAEALEAANHLVDKIREIYPEKLPDEEIEIDFKYNREQEFF